HLQQVLPRRGHVFRNRPRAVHRAWARLADGRAHERPVRGGQGLAVHVRAPARCGAGRFGDNGQGYSDGVARGGFLTRVLVIDDEAPIRLLCRVNLEAEKMEVIEAADGPTGLDLARTGSPDVVLLDVMMPGLDGWRVAEQLLLDPVTSRIPIIFLTARAEFRDRARG